MLCFRCEHRARFLEAVSNGEHPPRPRHECGDISQSKCGCYMFLPGLPIVVRKNDNDPRSMFDAPMIAARTQVVRVMDREEVKLVAIHDKDGELAVSWVAKHE